MAKQERKEVVIVTPIDITGACAQTGLQESELQGFFRLTQRTLDHTLQPAELDTLASTVESFGRLGIGPEALQVRVGIEDESHKRVPRTEIIEPEKWRPQIENVIAERHRRPSALPEQVVTSVPSTELVATPTNTKNATLDALADDAAQIKLNLARHVGIRKFIDPSYWVGRLILSNIPAVRNFYLQSNARRELFNDLFRTEIAHEPGPVGDFDRLFVADHGLGAEILINLGEELTVAGNLLSAYKGARKIAGVYVDSSANSYLDQIPGYKPKKNKKDRVVLRDIPEGIADIIAVIPLVPQLATELVVKAVRGLMLDEGVEAAFAQQDQDAFLTRHRNIFKAIVFGRAGIKNKWEPQQQVPTVVETDPS